MLDRPLGETKKQKRKKLLSDNLEKKIKRLKEEDQRPTKEEDQSLAKEDDLAVETAKKQKQTSLSKFLSKNKQFLGFENLNKALIITLKELFDNSFDACDPAKILPDFYLKITKRKGKQYEVYFRDNGMGIVAETLLSVFSKVLYGSKLDRNIQARGAQGLGIKGVILYSWSTCGVPIEVISKTKTSSLAKKFVFYIDIEKNEPVVIKEEDLEVDYLRGTEISTVIESNYVQTGSHSIEKYLELLSIINPHMNLEYQNPSGDHIRYQRSTDQCPIPAVETLPHVQGLDLGQLQDILTRGNRLKDVFNLFYGITEETKKEILQKSKLISTIDTRDLNSLEIEDLLTTLKSLKIKPPTECLSLIGKDLIVQAVNKFYKSQYMFSSNSQVDTANGHSFIIEGALFYGGSSLESIATDKIILTRVANKVPLIHRPAACGITKAVASFNWKKYGLTGGQEESLPKGPCLVFIHIASSKVPFASESKETISENTDITAQIHKVLETLGEGLKKYLNKEKEKQQRIEKLRIIKIYLPYLVRFINICNNSKTSTRDLLLLTSKVINDCIIQYQIKKGFYRYWISNPTTDSKEIEIKIEQKLQTKCQRLVLSSSTIKIIKSKFNLIFTDSYNFRYPSFELTETANKKIKENLLLQEQPSIKDIVDRDNQPIVRSIDNIFKNLQDQIDNYIIPYLEVKKRTRDNILELDKIWVLNEGILIKSGKTIKGTRGLIRILSVLYFLKYQLIKGLHSHLREVYYIMEGFNYVNFTLQEQCNYFIECTEIVLGLSRDRLNVLPDVNGHIIGNIIVEETTRNGLKRIIDCSKDTNLNGYGLPTDMSCLKVLSTSAKFAMAIESAGTFQRLIENKYDKIKSCILINLGGQPGRNTREIIRRIAFDFKVPILIFTDADGWSVSIAATINKGAIKSSHLSTSLVTNTAIHIGLKPSHIVKYKLPYDKLKSVDRLKYQQLLTDPRYKESTWREEFELALKLDFKAEQQALSRWGLKFITDVYLEDILKEIGLN